MTNGQDGSIQRDAPASPYYCWHNPRFRGLADAVGAIAGKKPLAGTGAVV